MEERIFKLESEIKELKNKIKMLEERLDRKHRKKSFGFENKDILEIIYKSVKDGTLMEDYIYYYVDKDIMHKIAEGQIAKEVWKRTSRGNKSVSSS